METKKFFIKIKVLGSDPIIGKIAYSEKHAKRLCKKHIRWSMIETPTTKEIGGKSHDAIVK